MSVADNPPAAMDALPHSREDELYTLGASVYSEEIAYRVAVALSQEDYHLPATRKIYSALKVLVDRGETPTFISLAREIRAALPQELRDDPFECLHPTELQSLLDRDIYRDTRGVPHAIERLKEESKYRILYRAAMLAASRARVRDGQPEEILEALETAGSHALSKSRSPVTWADEASREAEETYDKFNAGEIVGLPTGYPELDEAIDGGGFLGGDYIVLAGETSAGKTTLGLNIGANLAEAGYPGLILSGEMKTFKLFRRLHASRARVPAWKIRPRMDEVSGEGVRERLRATQGLVSSLPMGFVYGARAMDVMSARRILRDYRKRKKIKWAMFDYIGLMTPPPGTKGGAYERTSAVSRVIKDTLLEEDLAGLVVSQLRRKTSEERESNSELYLQMLKDSGQVENDADIVALMWDADTPDVIAARERGDLRNYAVKIAKQRDGERGARLSLKFAPDIYTFASVRRLEEAERELEEGLRP